MTTTAQEAQADQVHHPVFARFFDRLSRRMEPQVGEHRDWVLSGLMGRVLEVGAGNGINFSRYPPAVQELVALEPEPFLRAKAKLAAQRAPVGVRVQAGVAAPLPFESDSFDAAVASLVLCTVPDPRAALAELRRVLKPGGELRFFEHVRSERKTKARVQRLLDSSGLWPFVGGGCHCARPTAQLIDEAGFRLTKLETLTLRPAWEITNPHVRGIAHATA